MYYAYVLQNPQGVLYKGSTSDLDQRLRQHNSADGFHSYTKSKGPWHLVYYEKFDSQEDAINREKYFKTGKGREFLKDQIRRLSA